MKNILLLIVLIAFTACSSAFYDDGTNLTIDKSRNNFDDGTSLYNSSSSKTFDDGTNKYSANKKAVRKEKKPVKTTTKKTVKKKKTASKKKSIAKTNTKPKTKAVNNTTYTLNKSASDFYYPVKSFSVLKPYSESGTEKNTGIDFSINKNTEIFSCSPGVVIFSGEKNGLGNTIFVYHNNGFISIYYNLSTLKVNKGDYIKNLNTIIAYADDSFHFELRKQEKKGIITLDPKKKLKKRRK